MKVMAIGTSIPITAEQTQKCILSAVPATFLRKIEQYWFRRDTLGVIFLMDVDSLEQARAELDALSLTAAKLMSFDLIPVGPSSPLGLLPEPK